MRKRPSVHGGKKEWKKQSRRKRWTGERGGGGCRVKYCTSSAQCARFAVARGYFLFAGRVGVVYTHYRGHAEYFATPLITKKAPWPHVRARHRRIVRYIFTNPVCAHRRESIIAGHPRKKIHFACIESRTVSAFCIYTVIIRTGKLRREWVFISATIYIPDISPFLVNNMCICKHVYIWQYKYTIVFILVRFMFT